jgi:hypothetical protein
MDNMLGGHRRSIHEGMQGLRERFSSPLPEPEPMEE